MNLYNSHSNSVYRWTTLYWLTNCKVWTLVELYSKQSFNKCFIKHLIVCQIVNSCLIYYKWTNHSWWILSNVTSLCVVGKVKCLTVTWPQSNWSCGFCCGEHYFGEVKKWNGEKWMECECVSLLGYYFLQRCRCFLRYSLKKRVTSSVCLNALLLMNI